MPGWSTIQKRTEQTLAALAKLKSSALRKREMLRALPTLTLGVPLLKIIVEALAAKAEASIASKLNLIVMVVFQMLSAGMPGSRPRRLTRSCVTITLNR